MTENELGQFPTGIARSNIKVGWWFLDQSIFVGFNIFSDHIKENLLKKEGWFPLLCCFGENPV